MFILAQFVETCAPEVINKNTTGPLRAPPVPFATATSAWTHVILGAPSARCTIGVEVQMTLEVLPDPEENPSDARLLYQANLFMRYLPPCFPPRAAVQVGQIKSFRISKQTASLPYHRVDWINHFLQDEEMPDDLDMAFLLKTLYDEAGEPIETLIADIQQELKGDSLLYLKLVQIGDAHQGKGLSRYLFDLYYTLVKQLPECEFRSH